MDNTFDTAVVVTPAAQALLGKDVIFLGSNYFDNNWDDGLVVNSYGNISLSNVGAYSNGQNSSNGSGARLDNCDWGTDHCDSPFVKKITLTGINIFNNNYTDGLVVNASGDVSIAKLTTGNNGNNGVWVYSEAGNVLIACGSMTNNGNYGWGIELDGATKVLTLKGVFAYGNGTNTYYDLPGTTTPVETLTCP